MAATTTRYGLPYQESTDQPAGNTLGQNLATAVDTKLGIVDDASVAIGVRTTTLEAATTGKPLVRLSQAVAQSIPDNVSTELTFSTEDIDTANFHSMVTNTGRVTPTVAGYYRVTATFVPAARADFNTLLVTISKNGTGVSPAERIPFGGTSVNSIFTLQTSGIYAANGSTDYFSVFVLQDNVANVANNTVVGGTTVCTLEVEYLRP